MLIIIALLTTTIILNKHNHVSEINETIFLSEKTNFINNEKYSTVTEKITILEDTMNYLKTITYEDSSTISYERESIINNNTFLINNKTYYLKEDKICFDINCDSIWMNQNDYEDHYITLNEKSIIKSINNINRYKDKDLSIIYLYNFNYVDLSRVAKDYDITIYTLDSNTLNNKKTIQETYDINDWNTIVIFEQGKQIANISPNELHEYLFNKGINSRQ